MKISGSGSSTGAVHRKNKPLVGKAGIEKVESNLKTIGRINKMLKSPSFKTGLSSITEVDVLCGRLKSIDRNKIN